MEIHEIRKNYTYTLLNAILVSLKPEIRGNDIDICIESGIINPEVFDPTRIGSYVNDIERLLEYDKDYAVKLIFKTAILFSTPPEGCVDMKLWKGHFALKRISRDVEY